MRVYSPSQTTTWMQCPLKRALAYKEGWRPRVLGNREAAALLGLAVGAGVAGVYKGYYRAAAVAEANCVAGMGLEDYEKKGCRWADHAEGTAAAVPLRASKAVGKFIDAHPVPENWSVVAVEQSLPDHGHCRPDLIVRAPTALAVIDWKTKLSLKADYRTRELERHRQSWQMFHYTWAVGERYQETVSRYYIGLIVCEPFSVELIPYDVAPEHATMWLQSARRIWAQMYMEDMDIAKPWQAAQHADQYGNCEFYQCCFEAPWSSQGPDETVMAADYVRRAR